MLKMRLQRIGRRNSPAYRVLVVDSRQGPKSGKFVDQIGAYDPRTGDLRLDGEKAKTWIEKGVQLSGTVHNMLINQGIIEGKKVNVLPKKSPIVKEQTEEEVPAQAADAPADDTSEETSAGEADAPAQETETAAPENNEEAETPTEDAEEAKTSAS